MVIDSTLLLVLLRNEKNGYEQRVDVVTAGGIHLSTSNKTSKSSQKEKENRRCRNATDFSTAFFFSFFHLIHYYIFNMTIMKQRRQNIFGNYVNVNFKK